ncbi:ADP-ribosylglycohydrolase family protein [Candidatus Atribacteria bacterium 1244-E10-H5-B2]|nr:MAG: ADP-ribosylglycohydrolase family protein [Candidatus Atribacteria bacterium 1244-E10-H5-B2]
MDFVNIATILFYELKQKKEEGCDIEQFADRFQELVGDIPASKFIKFEEVSTEINEEQLEELYKEVTNLESCDKGYKEPFTFQDISNLSPGKLVQISHSGLDLKDKIYGAWQGRCAGCLLGKPVEGWGKAQIEDYLKKAGEYPLRNYFPKPVSDEFANYLHQESAGALRGHITHMVRDDDIDYPILNLNVLEKFGKSFTSKDVASVWLQNLPYEKTYTAERVAYKNFINGIWPPESGRYYNPYREWIGAQIRGDVFGWVNPGNPRAATEMAYRDAIISHRKNGIYGEMFVAAATSIALVLDTNKVIDVIETGLSVVPQDSRFAIALRNTIKWAVADKDWEQTFTKVMDNYGKYHFVHTINNAAIVVLSLIHGNGDYEKSISIAVMCGFDTDCNGATTGSIIGALSGAHQLPDKWIRSLNNRVDSLIINDSRVSISDLADRTVSLVQSIGRAG